MDLTRLVARLEGAARFVDAATIVCEETYGQGLHQCVVLLHLESGPPVLAVDNFKDIPDEIRLFGVSKQNWDTNPAFVAMREHLGSIGVETLDPRTYIPLARQHGYAGVEFYPFASPLIGPSGWFGTIQYASMIPYTPAIERDLALIATHLSVWCVHRGIGAVPDSPLRDRLGPGQHRAAHAAALGQPNDEIAELLGISINTVKKHLKAVFVRLDVCNRTQLANVFRRLAPRDDVPEGVTHLPTVNITRAPSVRAAKRQPVDA